MDGGGRAVALKADALRRTERGVLSDPAIEVIPAHPLALTARRTLDERRQRALTRYYLAAGADGLAVGVHTTQFVLHRPSLGMFAPVLELAMETARASRRGRPPRMIAGVIGKTPQALQEARLAARLGYDAVLLSLGALRRATDRELLVHTAAVAEVMPVIGFYLQPDAGGRPLGYPFWRRLVEIPDVVAVKVAPFDRYRTVDVVRAVIEGGRSRDIALYTGNDDQIVVDLLTRFRAGRGSCRMTGGLLGQWAVWTRGAVALARRLDAMRRDGAAPEAALTLGMQLTDANSAIFDAANRFRGCIPGIHEVLRRQGLLRGRWCLDPSEELSPGQMREIDRVHRAYPHLRDDAFVAEHLDEWLR